MILSQIVKAKTTNSFKKIRVYITLKNYDDYFEFELSLMSNLIIIIYTKIGKKFFAPDQYM